ncbi:MAG: hypothetical protein QQN63_05905 [Nitrosopumilus sp.]
MPYSSQDEIPASWKGKVTLDADPDKVVVSSNGKYFYHQCDPKRRNTWQGELRPQFKHGNCAYWCSNCKTIIPPTTIMALRLGREYDE